MFSRLNVNYMKKIIIRGIGILTLVILIIMNYLVATTPVVWNLPKTIMITILDILGVASGIFYIYLSEAETVSNKKSA